MPTDPAEQLQLGQLEQIVAGLQRRVKLLEAANDGATVRVPPALPIPDLDGLLAGVRSNGWSWLYLALAVADLVAFAFLRDWMLLIAAVAAVGMSWLSWQHT